MPKTATPAPARPGVDQEWLPVDRAVRITGKTRNALLKHAALGQIRVQALPGEALKLSAEDVANLK